MMRKKISIYLGIGENTMKIKSKERRNRYGSNRIQKRGKMP